MGRYDGCRAPFCSHQISKNYRNAIRTGQTAPRVTANKAPAANALRLNM